MKLFGRSAAFAASLLLAWQPQAVAGEASRHLLAYQIVLAGFVIGDVEVTAEFAGGEYHIVTDTRNTGVLRLLAEFTSHAQSRGRFGSGKVRPLMHRADNVWIGENRYVRNTYGDDGEVTVEVFPPAASDDRDDVPGHQIAGTVDPLSAVLTASLRAGGSDACRGSIAVFDGRRRYNLNFEHSGKGDVSGPVFDGSAIRCRVVLERIAGFSRHPWLPRLQSPDGADLWFGKVVADLPPVPVLLSADLGVGSVVINLVSLVAAPAAAADAATALRSAPAAARTGHDPGPAPRR